MHEYFWAENEEKKEWKQVHRRPTKPSQRTSSLKQFSLYDEVKKFVTATGVTLEFLKRTAKKLGFVVTQTSRTAKIKGYHDRVGFSFNHRDRCVIDDVNMPKTVFKFGGTKAGFFHASE